MALQHKRSSVTNKRPDPIGLSDGQLALNLNAASTGLFYRDASNNLVKVGPVHVGSGAPNASPATGGATGNTVGEQWLDTTGGNYVLKVYDGTAWRSVEIEPGSARQLLQTNAAGTDVEFTSNIDVPGTLDVTGAATFDSSVTVEGDLTVNGTTTTIDSTTLVVEDKNIEMGVVTTPTDSTADGGGITLKGATDKTINWVQSTGCWTFNQPTNFNDHVRINSSGSLGVGTSSPIRRLHVAVGGSDPQLRLQDTSATESIYSAIEFNGDSSRQAFIGKAGSSDLLIINDNNSGALRLYTNATERARIDSSGNLGVGDSSPDARCVVYRQTQFSGNTVFAVKSDAGSTKSTKFMVDGDGNVGIGTTSPGQLLHLSSASPRIRLTQTSANSNAFLDAATSGVLEFSADDNNVAASSSMRFKVDGTERMRIDSSGNVGIGTSSPGGKLHVESAATTAGWQIRTDSVGLSNESGFYRDASDHYELVLRNGSGGLSFLKNDGGASTANLLFNVQGSERMRIGSTGTAQTYADGSTDNLFLSNSTSAGTSVLLLGGRHSATSTTTGTVSFRVYTNGNVQNTNNSYGAISDAKLKENIVDASSQWDDIKGIRVRNYNFIEGQTHTQIGVVAQEVETVSPGLVFDTPDRDDEGVDLGTVTKSVNYSVLYMKAVKALQEAMNRIETLETKVAALEAG